MAGRWRSIYRLNHPAEKSRRSDQEKHPHVAGHDLPGIERFEGNKTAEFSLLAVPLPSIEAAAGNCFHFLRDSDHTFRADQIQIAGRALSYVLQRFLLCRSHTREFLDQSLWLFAGSRSMGPYRGNCADRCDFIS